jgi:hypothetical protein
VSGLLTFSQAKCEIFTQFPVDNFLQRRDLEVAVQLLGSLAESLDRSQRLDLGQREVGGEEAFLGNAIHGRGASPQQSGSP